MKTNELILTPDEARSLGESEIVNIESNNV